MIRFSISLDKVGIWELKTNTELSSQNFILNFDEVIGYVVIAFRFFGQNLLQYFTLVMQCNLTFQVTFYLIN